MPPTELQRPEPSIAPFGCQNCREQHLKCDRTTPSCGRCLAHGKRCRRAYKFRVKSGPFARKQPWLRTPKTLEFVLEDNAGDVDALAEDEPLLSDHGDGHSPVSEASRTPPTLEDDLEQPQPFSGSNWEVTPMTGGTHLPAQQSSQMFLASVATPPRPQSPTDRFIVHDDVLDSAIASGMGHGVVPAPNTVPVAPPIAAPAPPSLSIYLPKSRYPLQDKQEAFLVRHYTQNLALWLDICDPTKQFSVIVPQRAGTCNVLLNAIMALSAKHLSHVSKFDQYASDRYHQECLRVLIPLLSNESTAGDENLFAATIILRVWEEIEVKHSGFDTYSYLLGIQAFVHGHGGNIRPNSLSAASYWIGLRQEIYTATVHQQPVKVPLIPSLVDDARRMSPADDCTWANRAVVHCVDVLNFCFGDKSPYSWNELYAWNQRWVDLLPSSYTPVLELDRRSDEAFPEIWYHSSWHAKLFLVSFDPKVPRIGSRRREAANQLNVRICDLVRKMCGMGLSNQLTPPSLFTASMAIAAFGDRFQDRADQEALLEVLRRTERDHARPTEAVQQQLMRAWDWIDDGRPMP